MQKIKVEVIKQFTLGDYAKIKDTLKRKNTDKDGELYVGDEFYCDKEMAEYLLGNNKIKKAVVKVIEIIPEKEIQKATKSKKTIAKK